MVFDMHGEYYMHPGLGDSMNIVDQELQISPQAPRTSIMMHLE